MRIACRSVLSGATLTAVLPSAVRALPDVVIEELRSRDEADPAALLRAVRAVVKDPVALTKWLRSLSGEDVAAQSYWHKNGFAKLVLHADEFRIRMHVWPAGKGRLGESDPHGHRWNFASTVLCGDGLETEEFRESANGHPYVRHRYIGGGVRGLRACGAVGLERISRAVVGLGEHHTVDTSVIHTVRPVGEALVATLVVQSRMLTDDTAVYCASSEIVDDTAEFITPSEVDDLLADVCDALAIR
jgi:hypothetical protein